MVPEPKSNQGNPVWKAPSMDHGGIKALIITALSLALLIPLALLGSLVQEREGQSNEALANTTVAWGGPGVLAPPLLAVPYTYADQDEAGKPRVSRTTLWVVPKAMDLAIDLSPELRKRGIFTVPLYIASVAMELTFTKPDPSLFGPSHLEIFWSQASIIVPIKSPQSIMALPEAVWDGRTVSLSAWQGEGPLQGQAFAFPLSLEAAFSEPKVLSVDYSLKGSQFLSILPWAGQTRARIASTWTEPSFMGVALPDEHQGSEEGFTAQWTVNSFMPTLPEATLSLGQDTREPWELQNYGINPSQETGFGVRLFETKTVYTMTHRALRYGILLVILPFVALFIVELYSQKPIHPIQYALVGLANTVFYLLLLSISEHSSFGLAYLVAAVSVTGLLGWYTSVLAGRQWKTIVAMVGILSILYGYLYIALSSEDYALLIGAIGIFVVLALVMISTQKVDWYKGRSPKRPQPTNSENQNPE